MQDKLKVAVFFGGRSGEHEVSLVSARSVMAALAPDRYELLPVGITRTGGWITGAGALEALAREETTDLPGAAIFPDPGRAGLWTVTEAADRRAQLALLSRVDVAIPVLHGTFGEDGTLQGLLELAGIPYVGAGVLGSAAAMDKILFKDVCRAHGLPVAPYVALTRRQWEQDPEAVLEEVEVKAQLGYPLFTKPANLGSSVGITKCHDQEELRRGLDEAARYDRRLLVEAAVPYAREIEVSVLGNDEPEVSIPGEIIPSREFYDYYAKYLDEGEGASRLLIPAPLDEVTVERVRAVAAEAYKAVDCAGLARADFLLNRRTGELFLNELNTIPGFTPISMYPKLWAASGLSYPALLDRLIELARERHADNARSERLFRPGERGSHA